MKQAGTEREYLENTATQSGLDRLLRDRPDLVHKIQRIPFEVVGQCGNDAEYARHFDCSGMKLGLMAHRNAWHPELPQCETPPMSEQMEAEKNLWTIMHPGQPFEHGDA